MSDHKNRKNRGSIVVEMTLLMPVLLLCVFLYITAFLYCVEAAKQTYAVACTLYMEQELPEENSIGVCRQESTKIAMAVSSQKYADIKVEMRRDAGDPVQNLRRWQSIADAVSTRGDS